MEHEISRRFHHEALRELGAALRDALPALVAETEARLRDEQPETVARLDPALVTEGVTLTHTRFIAILEGVDDDAAERQVGLARLAAAAGLPVDALLAGYRVGAQVGWRHVGRFVRERGLPAEAVMALATASLAYVDELTSESFDGFGRAAAAAGGARARARQALLSALVDGTRDEAELAGLSADAAWPLPRRLRIGVLLPTRPETSVIALSLSDSAMTEASSGGGGVDDDAVLLGHVGGVALVAVGEPDGERSPGGAGGTAAVALGAAVAPARAPESLAQARRLAALAAAGHLPGDRTLRWEDHLAALVVHADAEAARALADTRLAPLDGLPEARAEMLSETLAAWLAEPGRPRAIAARLHLHPQTVRYRLARLRERFGDTLDDPQARFELALALRARGPARRPAPAPAES